MPKKQITEEQSSKRPADYTPQQGNKAALTLADFTDEKPIWRASPAWLQW